MNQPWNHSKHEIDMLLLSQHWDISEKMEALNHITRDRLQHFSAELLQELFLEFLIIGNL